MLSNRLLYNSMKFSIIILTSKYNIFKNINIESTKYKIK